MKAQFSTAVFCLLVVGGCVGASQRPTTQASSASPTSMPATADREKLVVGMGLGDALEMVTRHRIDFKIGYFDWGTTREVAVAQWFVIQRRDIDDALILCAESEHGETMRVRSLFWWRDYQRDVKLPKGKRKSKTTDVESVPMAEIERQFSEELNPYNSEKVEAREAKK